MKAAVEHIFTGITGSISSYTSSITSVGNLIVQYSGSNPTSNYITPKLTQYASIPEISGVTSAYPHVYKWSDRYYWIFTADVATAAATRRISLFQYDKVNEGITSVGTITLAFSGISGNKTSRAVRGLVYNHTTGSVTSPGTTNITGSGTLFSSERIAVGARIGFGTTTASQVSNWYNITAINSDSSLTVDQSVSVPISSSYIIEEIRVAYICTNVTLANGGLFLVKGLNYSTFLSNSSISEATTTDNVQAIYFLKDASVNNNTVAYGLGLDDEISKTEHYAYVLNADTTTSARIYKFNLREVLTVSSAVSLNAFQFKTLGATTTGTIQSSANGRIFSVAHGSANGIKSFWFCTTTRVYRCTVSDIVNSGSSHLTDSMIEMPAGSTTTYAASAQMLQVDYSTAIDRLIISTNTAPYRMHIAQYKTDGSQFEKYITPDLGRLRSSLTSVDVATPITSRLLGFNIWTEDGILFTASPSPTTGVNVMYVYPFSVDWSYTGTSGQYIITPKLTTLNAQKLYRAYVTNKENIGDENLGSSTDGFRLYVRTSGIDDNSGGWTLLDDSLDLTGIAPSTHIQFKIEFEVLSDLCIPTRIYSLCVVYEDGSQDYHYEPSLTYSSATNRIFAWRQAQSWGSNIPNLRIRLFNVANGLLIHDDDVTNSDYGTWEYSADAITWNSWSSLQDVVGNYIRYSATTLPNNITVRALLTQGS